MTQEIRHIDNSHYCANCGVSRNGNDISGKRYGGILYPFERLSKLVPNVMYQSALCEQCYQNKQNQKNERAMTMTLIERMASMKKAANNQNEKGKNTMTLQDKLQATKSILSQSSELTIDKFARIGTLEKKIDSMAKMIEILSGKIDTMVIDNTNICKLLQGIAKVQAENNALVETLIKRTVSTPAVPTIAKTSEETKAQYNGKKSEPTALDALTEDKFNQIYSDLVKVAKFCGSYKTDNSDEFARLLESIELTSDKTAFEKAVNRYWTYRREEDKFFIFGAPQKASAIDRLFEVLKAHGLLMGYVITPSKPIEVVKDSKYFRENIGISDSIMAECIETIKGLPKGEFESGVFEAVKDYCIEQGGKFNQVKPIEFFNWLKRFND